MFPELAIVRGLLGALSEDQRPLAHLVLVLGLFAGAAVVGAILLVRRRRLRRVEQDRGPDRIAEEE